MSVSSCINFIITNPVAKTVTVYQTTTNFAVAGYCNTNWWIGLSWTNSLTATGGELPSSESWSIPNLALAIGTNEITVTATNRGSAIEGAWDSATNAIYDTDWLYDQNGGAGWGSGWKIDRYFSANAGFFMATTNDGPNMSVGPRAWGLWANSGVTANAFRDFAWPLGSGQVFSLRFDNNWLQAGYSVGFGLQNSSYNDLFEFLFVGGWTNYVINDETMTRDTLIPWTSDGLTLSFELISTSIYRFVCGSTVITGTLKNVGGDFGLVRFRAWNYSSGPGWEYNLYLNDLNITRVEYSGPSTSDTVRIIRTDQVSAIPQAWRERYALDGEGGLDEEDRDVDGRGNLQEYWSDTNPNDPLSFFGWILSNERETGPGGEVILNLVVDPTTNSRLYDAYWNAEERKDGWFAFGLNVPGDPAGAAVTLTVTNAADSNMYYRAGVKLP